VQSHTTLSQPRAFLRELFDIAVAAADPMQRIPPALPPKPAGRVLVVGAGKASARMAVAVEAVWGPCEGLIITRVGYGRPLAGIEVAEASHPVPDARGLDATGRMLELLRSCGEGDFVLALISGGGSSLLSQPAGAITLEEERALNAALLASGAPIDAMNTVRKHLSLAKGGRLAAAAYPALMLALIVGRAGRRPGDDRLRPHGRRHHRAGRCPQHPRPLADPGPAFARCGSDRAEGHARTGRAGALAGGEPHHRRPRPVARRRGGAGARGGVRRAHPRGRDRGRGA
jgi:hypothetical protein